ncbi:hypothetical protein KI387_027732, partial [Taxus chinensis]
SLSILSMASSDPALDAMPAEAPANEDPKPTEEKPVWDEKKKKEAKDPKEKKPRAPKGSKPLAAHPSYVQMITEAITVLKERGSSSPITILKFLLDKYKSDLPLNFKKQLRLPLKNLTKSGKMTK